MYIQVKLDVVYSTREKRIIGDAREDLLNVEIACGATGAER